MFAAARHRQLHGAVERATQRRAEPITPARVAGASGEICRPRARALVPRDVWNRIHFVLMSKSGSSVFRPGFPGRGRETWCRPVPDTAAQGGRPRRQVSRYAALAAERRRRARRRRARLQHPGAAAPSGRLRSPVNKNTDDLNTDLQTAMKSRSMAMSRIGRILPGVGRPAAALGRPGRRVRARRAAGSRDSRARGGPGGRHHAARRRRAAARAVAAARC